MKADPIKKAVIEERDLLTDKVVALAEFMISDSAFKGLPSRRAESCEASICVHARIQAGVG